MFDEAVEFVFAAEGKQSNQAWDPGGLTKWGISSRAYPQVAQPYFSQLMARAIYREHYWDKLRLSEVPPLIAAAVFDCAVVCGQKQAALLTQRAFNKLRPLLLAQTHPLVEDGWLGPTSAQALGQLAWDRLRELTLALAINTLRRDFHAGLAKANKQAYGPPLFGWLCRVTRLDNFLIERLTYELRQTQSGSAQVQS